MKATGTIRPETLQNVGQGKWHYNYNVTEKKVQDEGGERIEYNYDVVVISGTPDYAKCVSAVLAETMSPEQEIAMLNKYVSYLKGIIIDSSIEDEYDAYLAYVNGVKVMVRDDLKEEDTPTLQESVERLKDKIEAYDKSDNVNAFILNGEKHWLDREMRRTIEKRCQMDLDDGIKVSNLSIGKFVYQVQPQKGLDMLHALERYAIQCFDNTQVHLRTVDNNLWESVEKVESYDYTSGYPDILNFDILSI